MDVRTLSIRCGRYTPATDLTPNFADNHSNEPLTRVGPCTSPSDSLQKVGQGCIGSLLDLLVAVAQHVEQAVEEVGQPVNHVDVWNAVEDCDPPDLGMAHAMTQCFRESREQHRQRLKIPATAPMPAPIAITHKCV